MTRENKNGKTRRAFLQDAAAGATAFAAMTAAPAYLANAQPNETIGVGHIGIGVRGGELVLQTAGEPDKSKPGIENVQVRGICDIYKPHQDKGIDRGGNPQAKRFIDYREMLADKDIDAVVIAVPDHSHSPLVIDAANAGKDVYIEKCWTRTLPEAKEMLKAIKYNKTVMQLGHDRSSPAAIQAGDLIRQGTLGEVTFVRMGCFRNRPRGHDEWRWYGYYDIFDRPDENMVRENLDWPRFLGTAPYHPFSMERFWHWRCYWDYGTGISGDLLSHAFDFAQSILNMGIPHCATTSGNNNLLQDGREAPDTWNTVFEYPQFGKGMSMLFSSMFNSQALTPDLHEVEIRGKDALMKTSMRGYEVYAEDASLKFKPGIDSGKIKVGEPFIKFDPQQTPEQPSHMQDFFDCIRSRKQPKDNEDQAFIEAVACIMSVESYFRKRTVFWDADIQEIV